MPESLGQVDKSGLRKEVIARRNALPLELRAEKSRTICEEVFKLVEVVRGEKAGQEPEGHAAPLTIALFSSFGSEVDTTRLAWLLYESKCRVCYPAMVKARDGEPPVMEFFEVREYVALQDKPLFMTKPSRGFLLEEVLGRGVERVDDRDMDFVVAPLVAFDDDGGRLGYGGGNYDAFLARLREGTRVVGVAFAEQRVDHVPREPHDLPLDTIVSC